MITRLSELIEHKGLSVRAFEKSINASDGMIRRAINNSTDIQSKWLAVIAEIYHDVNLEWLITGRGEMIKTEVIQTLEYKEILSYLRERENEIKNLNREIGRLEEQLRQGKKTDVQEGNAICADVSGFK